MESDNEEGEDDDEEDNDPVFDDDDGYDSDVTDYIDLDDDKFDDTDRNHNAEAVDADGSNRPEVDEFGTARSSQRAIGKSSFKHSFRQSGRTCSSRVNGGPSPKRHYLGS